MDELTFEETRTGLTGPIVVRHEPVGVVGAITPWNVPQYIIMCKLVPALLAGCTVVVKPAPETPLDALLLAELVDEAGFPEGVINVVTGGTEAGDALVHHGGVDKISFTGSAAVGKSIGRTCAGAFRRYSLELGGKSAAIVLDDADITAAVEGFRWTAFMNSGQVCAAQARILAPRSRYQEVVEGVAALATSLQVGDPSLNTTEVGPLVAARQRDRVQEYIAVGQKEGAKLVAGGRGCARRPGTRLVCQAHCFRGCIKRDADRSRRDLRACGDGNALRRRR